jgi:probable F420-dependent oxidoreductase
MIHPMTAVPTLLDGWNGLGVMGVLELFPPAELADFAVEVESLGYRTLWAGENVGRDPFAQLAYLAARTTTLGLATGIASIWARTPITARSGALTLAELSGGRFALGLGVSHPGFAEETWGADYRRPLSAMRAYLDAYERAPVEIEVAPPPLLLAALRPRMIELAAERADGVFPYVVTVEQVAAARAAIGPDTWLVASLAVSVDDNAERARAKALAYVATYCDLPIYASLWRTLGFGDEDVSSTPSPRLVEALTAFGNVDAVRARIAELHQAGADQVALMTLDSDPWFVPSLTTLRALAPAR